MQPIPPSRPNAYTGSRLDRAHARRDDQGWLTEAMRDPAACFIPVWRSRSLVRGAADAPEAVLLRGEQAAALLTDRLWALLGLLDGAPAFAVDLSDADAPLGLLPDSGTAEFLDLRGIAPNLSAAEAPVLAYARGLMHWRGRHKFCGVCGGACAPRSAGHVMVCPTCEAQHFPRTDPAVIMLVAHHDRALLGHSQRFPTSTMFSTLAGFVEPGESLEEAVAREVMEEAGVRVGRVYYHSSQPWPFPSSIMLGFHAEALSEAIVVDKSELTDARWFTRAQLRAPADHGFALPRADSIARRLIEDWIAAE